MLIMEYIGIKSPLRSSEKQEMVIKYKMLLNDNDQAAFNAALADYFDDSNVSTMDSFEYYVEVWNRLIQDIENGYDDLFCEYLNDISVRGILEVVKTSLPNELSAKIMSILSPMDKRFIASTRELKSQLSSHSLEGIQQFWFQRIPKKLIIVDSVNDDWHDVDWESYGIYDIKE